MKATARKKPMMCKRKVISIVLTVLTLCSFALGLWFALKPTIQAHQDIANGQQLVEGFEASAPRRVVSIAPAVITTVTPAVTETALPIEIPQEIQPSPATPPVTGFGILSIDRLDMKLPVVDSVSEELLSTAVCHVSETANIGSEGNAVIAGHRSYTDGAFFNRLGEAVIGDIIRYEDESGATFEYAVMDIREVEPTDQSAFTQPEGEYLLTLYTCTPIYTATHRLLVIGELISEEDAQ